MGAIKQIRRALINALDDFKSIFKRKKEQPIKRKAQPETITIPRKWEKIESPIVDKKVKIIPQKKWRLPGLRFFNRGLAALLLFLNFIFSQYLLGSIGTQAQVTFFLFLGNAYVMGLYLWKTRKKKSQ
jgi:hypothetical protein